MEVDNLQAGSAIGFLNQELERPHPQVRLDNFANYTVEKIRESLHCNFSQLSQQELVQCVTAWYESCVQAMLKYEYSMIDQWVSKHASMADSRGFELEDLLELLRVCRSSAIEVERWNEDVVSATDDVINEVLRRGVGNDSWKIPADFNYLNSKPPVNPSPVERTAAVAEESPVEPASERRAANRARLNLPIRVCGYGLTGYHLDLVLHAENFSCNGLYFVAKEPFAKGLYLQVTCPYPDDSAATRKLLSAKVVRVDRRIDKSRGIAVQFLDPMPRDAFQEQVLQVKPDYSR
jgi:hypothetical protein